MKRKLRHKDNADNNWKDVFNLFTYKQKFEKVFKEKVIQEKELETKSSLVETLVHNIPDLIWLKDKEGRYLKCNPMYEDYIGFKEEAILGKTDHDLIEKKLADSYSENELLVLGSKKATKEEEYVTFAAGGYQGWFEITKAPVYNKDGIIIGILGVGRNITELKSNIEELEKHRNNLEELVNERSAELKETNKDLTEINELFLGREAKIIEMKKEIEQLKKDNS